MISKKAPAFLGTPPGEGGGGGGKGGAAEGYHPAWQGPPGLSGVPKVGDTAAPGAKRRTLAPAGGGCPLIGAPRRGGDTKMTFTFEPEIIQRKLLNLIRYRPHNKDN